MIPNSQNQDQCAGKGKVESYILGPKKAPQVYQLGSEVLVNLWGFVVSIRGRRKRNCKSKNSMGIARQYMQE